MNSELNQQQIDWLAQAEELSNYEAEKINGGTQGSWFESMAHAWGEALDAQAKRIVEKAKSVSVDVGGSPSQMAELIAESLRMSYLSNSSKTSLKAVGSALEALARKQ